MGLKVLNGDTEAAGKPVRIQIRWSRLLHNMYHTNCDCLVYSNNVFRTPGHHARCFRYGVYN